MSDDGLKRPDVIADLNAYMNTVVETVEYDLAPVSVLLPIVETLVARGRVKASSLLTASTGGPTVAHWNRVSACMTKIRALLEDVERGMSPATDVSSRGIQAQMDAIVRDLGVPLTAADDAACASVLASSFSAFGFGGVDHEIRTAHAMAAVAVRDLSLRARPAAATAQMDTDDESASQHTRARSGIPVMARSSARVLHETLFSLAWIQAQLHEMTGSNGYPRDWGMADVLWITGEFSTVNAPGLKSATIAARLFEAQKRAVATRDTAPILAFLDALEPDLRATPSPETLAALLAASQRTELEETAMLDTKDEVALRKHELAERVPKELRQKARLRRAHARAEKEAVVASGASADGDATTATTETSATTDADRVHTFWQLIVPVLSACMHDLSEEQRRALRQTIDFRVWDVESGTNAPLVQIALAPMDRFVAVKALMMRAGAKLNTKAPRLTTNGRDQKAALLARAHIVERYPPHYIATRFEEMGKAMEQVTKAPLVVLSETGHGTVTTLAPLADALHAATLSQLDGREIGSRLSPSGDAAILRGHESDGNGEDDAMPLTLETAFHALTSGSKHKHRELHLTEGGSEGTVEPGALKKPKKSQLPSPTLFGRSLSQATAAVESAAAASSTVAEKSLLPPPSGTYEVPRAAATSGVGDRTHGDHKGGGSGGDVSRTGTGLRIRRHMLSVLEKPGPTRLPLSSLVRIRPLGGGLSLYALSTAPRELREFESALALTSELIRFRPLSGTTTAAAETSRAASDVLSPDVARLVQALNTMEGPPPTHEDMDVARALLGAPRDPDVALDAIKTKAMRAIFLAQKDETTQGIDAWPHEHVRRAAVVYGALARELRKRGEIEKGTRTSTGGPRLDGFAHLVWISVAPNERKDMWRALPSSRRTALIGVVEGLARRLAVLADIAPYVSKGALEKGGFAAVNAVLALFHSRWPLHSNAPLRHARSIPANAIAWTWPDIVLNSKRTTPLHVRRLVVSNRLYDLLVMHLWNAKSVYTHLGVHAILSDDETATLRTRFLVPALRRLELAICYQSDRLPTPIATATGSGFDPDADATLFSCMRALTCQRPGAWSSAVNTVAESKGPASTAAAAASTRPPLSTDALSLLVMHLARTHPISRAEEAVMSILAASLTSLGIARQTLHDSNIALIRYAAFAHGRLSSSHLSHARMYLQREAAEALDTFRSAVKKAASDDSRARISLGDPTFVATRSVFSAIHAIGDRAFAHKLQRPFSVHLLRQCMSGMQVETLRLFEALGSSTHASDVNGVQLRGTLRDLSRRLSDVTTLLPSPDRMSPVDEYIQTTLWPSVSDPLTLADDALRAEFQSVLETGTAERIRTFFGANEKVLFPTRRHAEAALWAALVALDIGSDLIRIMNTGDPFVTLLQKVDGQYRVSVRDHEDAEFRRALWSTYPYHIPLPGASPLPTTAIVAPATATAARVMSFADNSNAASSSSSISGVSRPRAAAPLSSRAH